MTIYRIFQYIDEQFKNPVYDPTNEYSVPYTWGTVGIFYNTDMVDEEDLQQGWNILWNEKYKGQILMFDNPRGRLWDRAEEAGALHEQH